MVILGTCLLVGAPFCGAPVRPNMLNMPKSAFASAQATLNGFTALRERGTSAHPSFRPMSIVATVAHLSYC